MNNEIQTTENITAQKPVKSGSGKLSIVLMLIMSAMLVALVVMLAISMKNNKENDKRIDELSATVNSVSETANGMGKNITEMNEKLVNVSEFVDEFSQKMGAEFGPTTEDDVTIGMEYEIVSTKELSDAYLAGDWSQLTEEQQKTIEMADAVIKDVIKEGMTDYEKEKAIYDWIHANVSVDDGITVAIPTTGNYCDNPYGVLTTRKAVCVGFATTFRLFMQMLDIDCMVVHDTYLSHSWNLVKLGEGWYHVDNYMDNGSTKYVNFNMTDAMCAMGHEWDTEFFPAATATEYSYIAMNSVDFTTLEAFAKDLREIVEGEETVQRAYKITSDDMLTIAQQLEIIAGEVDSCVSGSEISMVGYFTYGTVSMDADCLYYGVSFECFMDGGEFGDDFIGDITDEQMQDAMDAVEDQFGDFFEKHEEVEEDYGDMDDMWELF